ncbi:MAG: hypothetical protein NC833_06925, partial [Candidatus Omnitrophica bacterium]|nr:hypothetical protein [Candidatus Omnitrophota bacterium]
GIVNDPNYGTCHLYSTKLITSTSAIDQANIYPYDWAMEYQGGDIPSLPDNYRGSDFFLCLRTNEYLKYNSKFRVRIPSGGLTLTTPLEGRYNSLEVTTNEMYGNVYTEIEPLTEPGTPNLPPNSNPTPIFKVILNDNNSGKNPKLEGITVEFYDRSNFTLDDLKDFSPLSPIYNNSTGWYDITNYDYEGIKDCGVVIYGSDNNGNINYNDPKMIKRYRILSYGGIPSAYQFEFKDLISIPTTLYVVIRTSLTFTPGDSFDSGIVSWGLDDFAWENWASRAIPIIDGNGLRTNVYARKQSGSIFNPPITGTITLSISSNYDYIKLNWLNQTGKENEFDHYEIIRNYDDTNSETIYLSPTEYPFSSNTYYDRRENLNGPKEGIKYSYTLRMYYLQGGDLKFVDSNTVPDILDPYYGHKGKILGFPDSMAPSNVNAIPGINSITLYWRDNSYDENNPTKRATQFLIRRTKLDDGTWFETYMLAHSEPEFVDYTYFDSYLVQPNIKYRYEVYAQRYGQYGIVESRPGTSNEVSAYGSDGTEPTAGGGCFIATVCFGSPLSKYVSILREFRDKVLVKSILGRKFVKWYYKNGPHIAQFVSKYQFFKIFLRIILYPIIGICYLILKGFLPYFIIIFNAIFIFKFLKL